MRCYRTGASSPHRTFTPHSLLVSDFYDGNLRHSRKRNPKVGIPGILPSLTGHIEHPFNAHFHHFWCLNHDSEAQMPADRIADYGVPKPKAVDGRYKFLPSVAGEAQYLHNIMSTCITIVIGK